MTRSTRWVWFAVLSVLLLPLPALAQHEKGDTSLTGAGSISVHGSQNGGESGADGVLIAQIGYFAGANTEIGGLGSIFFQSGGDPSAVGLVGGYFRQYWGSDRTRPYLAFQGLTIVGGGVGGNGRAVGGLGVRRYLTRNSAVFVEGDYGVSFGGGETQADKGLTVVFGFSVIL